MLLMAATGGGQILPPNSGHLSDEHSKRALEIAKAPVGEVMRELFVSRDMAVDSSWVTAER